MTKIARAILLISGDQALQSPTVSKDTYKVFSDLRNDIIRRFSDAAPSVNGIENNDHLRVMCEMKADAFTFDILDTEHPDLQGKNIITVCVSNADMGYWFQGCGLYDRYSALRSRPDGDSEEITLESLAIEKQMAGAVVKKMQEAGVRFGFESRAEESVMDLLSYRFTIMDQAEQLRRRQGLQQTTLPALKAE